MCSDTLWKALHPSVLSPLIDCRLLEGKPPFWWNPVLSSLSSMLVNKCPTQWKHAMGQDFSLYSINILNSFTFSLQCLPTALGGSSLALQTQVGVISVEEFSTPQVLLWKYVGSVSLPTVLPGRHGGGPEELSLCSSTGWASKIHREQEVWQKGSPHSYKSMNLLSIFGCWQGSEVASLWYALFSSSPWLASSNIFTKMSL